MEKTGIYVIECVENARVYIGKAVDIGRRWTSHRIALRNGYHANAVLQNCFDKYGEDSLDFRILQDGLDSESIEKQEEYWIQEFVRDAGDKVMNFFLLPYSEPRLNTTPEYFFEQPEEEPEEFLGALPQGYADKHRPAWHGFVYGGQRR